MERRKDEIEERVDVEKPQFWDGSVSSKTIRLWASGGALKKMSQLIVLDGFLIPNDLFLIQNDGFVIQKHGLGHPKN